MLDRDRQPQRSQLHLLKAFTHSPFPPLSPLSQAKIAPTEHVLLAVDGAVMRPLPPLSTYAHNVVYLGQMTPTKQNLVPTLEAVKDLGLAIYGLGESPPASHLSCGAVKVSCRLACWACIWDLTDVTP